MSGRVNFHSVIADNNIEDGFGEFDVVDFTLSFPNRMIALNKIRLTGQIQVQAGGADVAAQTVQFDELVGAHALFQSIQTQIKGQTIDNLFEYPRLVKMVTAATENSSDMNMASNLCELKAPNQGVAQELLRREKIPAQHTSNVSDVCDFSVKPMIALNSVYGDRAFLPYEKSGDIRITVTLARNASALFGVGVDATYDYKLTDLRCEFMSYPSDGDMSPILHKNRQLLKQSIESGSAQLNFNYPMMANSVYGSFMIQALEGAPEANNTELNKPPAIDELSFFWNNTTNEYISYVMRSSPEILDYAIDAVGNTGRNSASTSKLASNNGFLVGVRMGENVDLMQTKISMVLNSGITNNEPYIFYMVADGIGEL